MKMNFRFQIHVSEDDYLEYNKFWVLRSPYGRKSLVGLRILDVVIILSSMLFPSYTSSGELVPFPEKLATSVYGLIMITVSGYAVDLYLSGSKQSVQVFIFSRKYAEIADSIVGEMKRGVTIIHAEGWYTKEESEVIMVMTRKTDLNLLLRYIKSIDPDAFLSVTNVMGVFGKGFDSIKVKSDKKH